MRYTHKEPQSCMKKRKRLKKYTEIDKDSSQPKNKDDRRKNRMKLQWNTV